MSATEWIVRLGEHVAKLETENADLRQALDLAADERREMERALKKADPACIACGKELPSQKSIDVLRSHGLYVTHRDPSVQYAWSLGACSAQCLDDATEHAKLVNEGRRLLGLRVLDGGATHG